MTGRLQQQDRPSLDREAMDNPLVDRKLVPCFVVRAAKVEYLEEQSDREHRFGPIYGDDFHRQRDGIAELLALRCYQKNPVAGSTEALLFFRRNVDVIDGILRKATPATNEVLVKRIHDRTTPDSIRLIYAGMLAWLGDARGRVFLLERTDPDARRVLIVVYRLGRFSRPRRQGLICGGRRKGSSRHDESEGDRGQAFDHGRHWPIYSRGWGGADTMTSRESC